jgi:hypothetical protein
VTRYRLYGFTVESDLPQPELLPSAARPQITIQRGAVTVSGGGWFDIWPHSDGASSVRACRTATGYRIRHGERAAFEVDRQRTIVYDAPDCAAALLRHFLLDQVVPLMLSLDGLVMHASSVAFTNGISAFVGPGGAGKSTLALALSRGGYPIVSDDGLLLRADGARFTATAAYPGIRLWDDSASALDADDGRSIAGAAADKSCYRDPAAFGAAGGQLCRVYAIDPCPSPDVSFTPVTGPPAAIEIVRQTYRLALDDRQALASQLDAIVALTRAVRVWRLAFPRALGGLAALAARVAAHAERHA